MGWGISRLIFLKSVSCFGLFVFFNRYGFPLLSIPFLYASFVAALVSLVSHPLINLPVLLGKKSDGSFPLWALIMFGPYLFFVRFFSTIRRFASREEPYTEVIEGLYVGGWPCSADRMPPGNPAVVDCTCELPRNPDFLRNSYLCVPTWDTRAPYPRDIESAVKWALRKRTQGVPIFIHCAYGHGRSVAVTCALLVALGAVDDWKNAEKLIKEKRPYIRMNSLHRKALDEWSKNMLSTPRRDGQGLPGNFISSDAS